MTDLNHAERWPQPYGAVYANSKLKIRERPKKKWLNALSARNAGLFLRAPAGDVLVILR
jgi:hypothetical protein